LLLHFTFFTLPRLAFFIPTLPSLHFASPSLLLLRFTLPSLLFLLCFTSPSLLFLLHLAFFLTPVFVCKSYKAVAKLLGYMHGQSAIVLKGEGVATPPELAACPTVLALELADYRGLEFDELVVMASPLTASDDAGIFRNVAKQLAGSDYFNTAEAAKGASPSSFSSMIPKHLLKTSQQTLFPFLTLSLSFSRQ
jgi:hypothetical protein